MIEIFQEYWRPFLYQNIDGTWSGLTVTLWLLAVSLAFGFVISIFTAIGRNSARWYIKGPIWLFTYIFRGTPLYIQILFIYVGIYGLDFVKHTPSLESFFSNGFNCLVLALVLNNVAYTTEIFAGAIRATPTGEVEAARAYGMNKFTLYRRIILPSALRRALPGYSNEVILMLHATSLAFTATVPDILKIARDANAATYLTFGSFGAAALLYLLITLLLVGGFRIIEKRTLGHLQPKKS